MIDHLQLTELDHPSKADSRADLQMVLVLDITRYTDKAMLLSTRQGKVWVPRRSTYFAPESTHAHGVIVYIPKWLAEEKFGVLKR